MIRRMVLMTATLVCLALLGTAGSARTQPAAQRQAVQLNVLLPHAKAQLMIEDRPTQQVGTSRSFVSPPLDPGRTYTYTLSVTWQPNNYTTITRTRKVPVQAGQTVQVDLRKADDKEPDKIVVRYVPTPDEVVEAMCKLAGVTKDDVVYDLGCGDGRMVITAVKQFGAKRGVGVDIDPERVKESKENAKKSGVEERLEFRQGDVLEIKDLPDANVVLLYMGDDLNQRLRPILQKTLKPGSRIVSHRFLMGDWKPLKTEAVTDTYGGEYEIHLWKIGQDGEKKD